MNPRRLTASGLGRFPDIDIELPAGTCAVVGPNGAGKSTLLNAIERALFADGSRDLAPMLGPFTDRLEITLEFEHAGQLWRVRRGYRQSGSGGKATLDFERHVFSGADGPSDAPGGWHTETRETAAATQAHVCATLGLSRQTFNASAFLAQGDAGNFPEASAVDRKAILGAILDPHGTWPRLAEKAKAAAREAEQSIGVAQGHLAAREAQVAALPGVELDVVKLADLEAQAGAAVTVAEDALEQAREAQAANAAAAERVATLAARYDAAKADHDRALLEHGRAQTAKVALEDAREELAVVGRTAALLPDLEKRDAKNRQARQDADAARDRRTQADHHAATLGAEAGRLHGDGVRLGEEHRQLADRHAHLLQAGDGEERCGECKQILGTESRQEAIASLAVRLAEMETRISEQSTAWAAAHKQHQAAVAAADAIEVPTALAADLTSEIRVAREAVAQKAALAERVRQLEQAASTVAALEQTLAKSSAAVGAAEHGLAEARAGARDADSLRQVVVVATGTVESKRKQRETIAHDLIRARHQLEQLQATGQEAAALRLTIAKRQQDLDLYRLAERAYGRDGIPTLIAENVFPQIESEANRILAMMPTAKGETLRLELHTQRALKTADHLRETLDIVVEDQFGPRAYESYSGGEKGRLNVALRLALALLLTSRRGAESKVLVLDEVPYLDALGEQQLVAVIASVSSVYDRVLTVAHSAGVADAFETVIQIDTDTRGVSRVVTAEEPVAVPA